MSYKNCFNEVKGAFGDALSDEDVLDMLEEFDAAARAEAEQKPYANVEDELFKHATRAAKEAHEKELIKRRNQMMNNRKEASLRGVLDQADWQKDPAAAVAAKDVGSLGFAKGGKASVFRVGSALAKHWLGSLENALDKAGLTRAISKGVLDAQIADELWQLGRVKGGKPGVSGSKEALEAARIIHQLQEVQVSRLNRAGAYIKRMPGYIVRQSYNARKIKAAGFAKWFAETVPRVDEMRTFNRLLASDEREAIYTKLFNDFTNGRFPSVLEDQPWSGYVPGGGNLAKRVSQHREIHYKDGASWFANHSAYGDGTLLENVSRASISNARAAALMETYGSNPREMHKRFAEEADSRAAQAGAKTSEARNKFSEENLWGIISGESNRPSDASLARLGNAVRSLQVASKLGSAVISAYLTDPALQFNEMSRHGVGFLRKATAGWGNVIRLATESGEQRQLANMLGAYKDGIISDVWGRFDTGDGLPGWASWFARKTLKMSGFQFETDAHNAGIVSVISHQLAEQSKVAHGSLDPAYARMLEAYGIGEKDWDKLAGAFVKVDDRDHVVPHALQLEAFGDTATPAGRRAARRARDELATKLMAFVDDRRAASISEPGGRTKAILHGGARPGTWQGEAWRSFMLFKSFQSELLTRVWGERIAEGEYVKLAGFVLATTVLGSLQNVVRDGMRGIATDFENMDAGQAAQFFARAAISGGGFSLLGDFVLGEHNRYGAGLTSTLAGPVFGNIDTAEAIYAGLIRGEDASAKAFRALYTNSPFVNLWWLRPVLDYALLYPMQEYLNPGYLKRMEQRRKQDTGQHYLLAPSSVVGR